jgi:hypothetical protein
VTAGPHGVVAQGVVYDIEVDTSHAVNEVRRMHAILLRPAHPTSHHLHWSLWLRRHQARCRHCH